MLNEKKNILEEQTNQFKASLHDFESLRQFKGQVPQIQYYE